MFINISMFGCIKISTNSTQKQNSFSSEKSSYAQLYQHCPQNSKMLSTGEHEKKYKCFDKVRMIYYAFNMKFTHL